MAVGDVRIDDADIERIAEEISRFRSKMEEMGCAALVIAASYRTTVDGVSPGTGWTWSSSGSAFEAAGLARMTERRLFREVHGVADD